jgi:hypothetical protein
MGGDMKQCSLVILPLVVLLVSGCSEDLLENTATVGDTTMSLHFDLLKELDPTQRSMEYGYDPVIPDTLGLTSLPSPVEVIDVRDEMVDVNSIESVEMYITIEFQNETGTAELTYNAYLAGMEVVDPFQTSPIISETVHLNGAEDATSEIEVIGDERLLELFNEGIMQYCAEVMFDIVEGLGNVSGVAEVVRFDVTVVTTL